jgi:hypothetical protein
MMSVKLPCRFNHKRLLLHCFLECIVMDSAFEDGTIGTPNNVKFQRILWGFWCARNDVIIPK